MNNSSTRNELLKQLFDTMDIAKRGMQAHFQSISRLLPISRTQLELLVMIQHNQPISFKELAKQLYLTPGAISQQAEVLEEQKYIKRQTDMQDRRVQSLIITRLGQKLLHDVDKRRRAILSSAFEEMTDEELEIWLRIQRKMIAKFQTDITKQSTQEK